MPLRPTKVPLPFSEARDSDDVPAIGQGIFLIPGFGTLSKTTSTKQEVPVVGCPNSAGKDFVAIHLISLYNAILPYKIRRLSSSSTTYRAESPSSLGSDGDWTLRSRSVPAEGLR